MRNQKRCIKGAGGTHPERVTESYTLCWVDREIRPGLDPGNLPPLQEDEAEACPATASLAVAGRVMQRQRHVLEGTDQCTGTNIQPSPRPIILAANYHQPSPLKGGSPAVIHLYSFISPPSAFTQENKILQKTCYIKGPLTFPPALPSKIFLLLTLQGQ